VTERLHPLERNELAAEAHLRSLGFEVERGNGEALVTGRGFSVRVASLLQLVRIMDQRDPPPVPARQTA